MSAGAVNAFQARQLAPAGAVTIAAIARCLGSCPVSKLSRAALHSYATQRCLGAEVNAVISKPARVHSACCPGQAAVPHGGQVGRLQLRAGVQRAQGPVVLQARHCKHQDGAISACKHCNRPLVRCGMHRDPPPGKTHVPAEWSAPQVAGLPRT